MKINRTRLKLVERLNVPPSIELGTAYRLKPKNPDASYYAERTDRNIGWITPREQELLHSAVVGIAGCGGMGGLLASILVRAGVGEVRIADNEVFDTSNINRQYAATRYSVGKSKAIETARMLRQLSDDTTIVVYPDGINPNTVDHFLDGCDIVCDEIEFWAAGSRILLHKRAYSYKKVILNCNTVGFGTRLFYFPPKINLMEDMLGFNYETGMSLQERIQHRTAHDDEVKKVMDAVLRALVPELPEYCPNDSSYKTVEAARRRLFEENKATIISSNPPLATGFIADHVLLRLLKKTGIRRDTVELPDAPGYLYFDAALFTARKVERMSVS